MSTPTADYKFNQIGIRVSDLQRSLHFYQDVLGMKELGHMEFDTIKIWFVGYPEKDAGAEGSATKNPVLAREGVLELIWSENSLKNITNANDHPGFGLIKLCFTVPDISACMKRMEDNGVKILKQPGSPHGLDVAARAIGTEMPDQGKNQGLWTAVTRVGFVEDPDGYLVEIVQY
ncbi:lactoylglutathione lyase [Fonsecaea erecta]|uniref:Lactoylglutathione lyase n=1 Tax=Fonsecaea erecta TaxID=1367422 RepID=A0A178ZD42_9EURO|nr:lactoylglutathione lyase [Fonsecaea erecta]OAP57572.1 lactoylglutathione lyase [Fonsecaea erecta]